MLSDACTVSNRVLFIVTKKRRNETTSIIQKMKTIDYTTASGNEEGMSVLFFFIVEHFNIPFFFVIFIG